jgi:hypothetical protein
MDAIADVASDGWLCVASVDNTSIALDSDVDVFGAETTPELFDEGNKRFAYSRWDVVASFEIFAKIVAVSSLVVL